MAVESVLMFHEIIGRTEYLSSISLITASGFHQLWLKIHVRNMKSIIVCTTYRPRDTPIPYLISIQTSQRTLFMLLRLIMYQFIC